MSDNSGLGCVWVGAMAVVIILAALTFGAR